MGIERERDRMERYGRTVEGY
jgi:hypothetical protein